MVFVESETKKLLFTESKYSEFIDVSFKILFIP